MYFISDSHVRETMYAHRPLIKGDFYRALMGITVEVLDNSVPGEPIIFTGDNMHFKKVLARDADLLKLIISTFQETGHPVYGIQGNHDLNEGVSWVEVCGGTKLDDGKVHTLGGLEDLTVVGFDYTPGELIFDRLASMEKDKLECSFLIMHQPFKHNCAWDQYALDVDDIPACVTKAVISGHIHTPEIRMNSLGRSIVSVGSTTRGKFGDHDGCYLRYTKQHGFQHIPTSGQRGMERRVLENDADKAGILEYLNNLTKDTTPENWPLFEITFRNGYPNDPSPFKPFEDRAHLFYSTDLEMAVDNNEQENMMSDLSWEGILPKCSKDPEVISELSGLLHDISGKSLENLKEKYKRQTEELKNAVKEAQAV